MASISARAGLVAGAFAVALAGLTFGVLHWSTLPVSELHRLRTLERQLTPSGQTQMTGTPDLQAAAEMLCVGPVGPAADELGMRLRAAADQRHVQLLRLAVEPVGQGSASPLLMAKVSAKARGDQSGVLDFVVASLTQNPSVFVDTFTVDPSPGASYEVDLEGRLVCASH